MSNFGQDSAETVFCRLRKDWNSSNLLADLNKQAERRSATFLFVSFLQLAESTVSGSCDGVESRDRVTRGVAVTPQFLPASLSMEFKPCDPAPRKVSKSQGWASEMVNGLGKRLSG